METEADPTALESLPGTDYAAFRLACGVYVGAILAGVAATAGALADASTAGVAAAGALAFGIGVLVGLAAASRADRPSRLGRRRRSEWRLFAPALVFAAAALASLLGLVGSRVLAVAFPAALAVVASGSLVGHVARNWYVSATVDDEPVASSRWTPWGSRRLDLVIVGGWALLAVFNAGDGDWLFALVWAAIALGWIASSANGGRLFAGGSAPLEIRAHEAGLVERRRYTASLVPWEEVRHARLRDGELVLERRLFDVRVEIDDLGDAEALFAAVEDRLAAAESAR